MLDDARSARLLLAARWRRAAVPVLIAFGLLGFSTSPASAASSPTIRFVSPSPAEGATLPTDSITVKFTYNRRPTATRTVVCTLSGPTSSSGPCDSPVASGSRSQSGAAYSGLANGSYTFTVSLTLTDGGTASGTRHFTVALPVTASGASAIASGGTHACAVTSAGAVKCWGHNSRGQLGNGTHTSSNVPVNVSGLGSGVDAIAAGHMHTCALTSAGAVKCWGRNDEGQLGNGTDTSSNVPVDVSGLESGVSAIAASANGSHTCALTSAGAVKCWGHNTLGQLGNGTTTSSDVPVDVSGLGSDVDAISAGGAHTCAVTSAGAARCWGRNHFGELGNGTNTLRSTVPVDVSGLGSGVSAISAGGEHTCALTSAGAVKCWGHNSFGELGNGTNAPSNVPVNVSELASDVDAIATGVLHTCALTSAGAAKCWGRNTHGQLGNGTNTSTNVPIGVSGLASGVSSIAPGPSHTCALTSVGAAKCWGQNVFGQLGDGTHTSSNVPIDVLL